MKKETQILSEELASQLGESETLWAQLRRMAKQNKLAVASAVLLILLLLAAVFAPVLTPYDAVTGDTANRLQPPSAAHWLGTDEILKKAVDEYGVMKISEAENDPDDLNYTISRRRDSHPGFSGVGGGAGHDRRFFRRQN